MDIYIVHLLGEIIGASAKQQGAELIKADWINQQERDGFPAVSPLFPPEDRRLVLERSTKIENRELQDVN